MSAENADDTARTAVETLLAEHKAHWEDQQEPADPGRCGCGIPIRSEDEHAKHAMRVLIAALWKPTAEAIHTAEGIRSLPARTTILVGPGREDGFICRSTDLAAPEHHIWVELGGRMHEPPFFQTAVVLERGPGT